MPLAANTFQFPNWSLAIGLVDGTLSVGSWNIEDSPPQVVVPFPSCKTVPLLEAMPLVWFSWKVMAVGDTVKMVKPPVMVPLVKVPALKNISDPVNPATSIVIPGTNPAVTGLLTIVSVARLLDTLAAVVDRGWQTAML